MCTLLEKFQTPQSSRDLEKLNKNKKESNSELFRRGGQSVVVAKGLREQVLQSPAFFYPDPAAAPTTATLPSAISA